MRVRFGVVGCGGIATLSHLPALSRLAEAELVGVCDTSRERVERAAAQWGARLVCTDYRELVASPDIDAVVVAVPNLYHRPVAEAAAGAGKHVFCEKPIATHLRDARAMVEACRRAGVRLQIGFNQRFWNQVEIARQLLDAGAIGQVVGFRSVLTERWDVYPAATDARYRPEIAGGACIIDLAVHRIDMARHLVGEVSSLVAELKHLAMPARMDDSVSLLLNFANDASGSIYADRISPMISNATDVYGTEGIIYISTETVNPFQSAPLAIYSERSLDELPEIVRKYAYPVTWWSQPGRQWVSIVPPRDDSYEKELRAFCWAIAEDGEPPVTGEDGVQALEIVLAAYKSVRERAWVHLPLAEEVVEPPTFD